VIDRREDILRRVGFGFDPLVSGIGGADHLAHFQTAASEQREAGFPPVAAALGVFAAERAGFIAKSWRAALTLL